MGTVPDPFPVPLLRPMVDSDLDAVVTIECDSYPFPWSRKMFVDCLAAGYRGLVLETADRLAGYGVMMFGYGEVHLLNLCVRTELRGLGYARRLLEQMLQLARCGDAAVALLEVRPSNLPALRLYQQAGFVQVGARRDYYPAAVGREDALLLRKLLR
ncbi:MAG: ribosomal protein S18-alanine N-acetyltransferase [Gammaproteobacteria bacterium]|nr:ribosomal protein S18-alanine N-acetyltransferase [Gammaproteobacteria bacterium]